jgi:hypothetical protein
MELSVIQSKIYEFKGYKVMLDFDLAEIYETPTKALKQVVKRNINRFPADFMFELSNDEFLILRSQFVTSNWGGMRYAPFAFTEQGVALLASVLKSEKAIEKHTDSSCLCSISSICFGLCGTKSQIRGFYD